MLLTSNQKDAIAETAIIHAAARLGVGIPRPMMDERYDLVFDLRPRLLRVQCKWAVRQDGVVVVRCASCRRTADGLRRTTYSAEEIDLFAAYCADLDRSFLLPVADFDGYRAIQLRLDDPRNNQTIGINWAGEFDFAATLSRLQGP